MAFYFFRRLILHAHAYLADFLHFPAHFINWMVFLRRLLRDTARMRLPTHLKKFVIMKVGNPLNVLFFHIHDIRV
ncbi:hypothetical protein B6N31_00605 [Dickeya fangzhongdai]|nr:hypothetical protein B6N31_00605 [Dickeya fangzhongdai]